MPSTSPGSNASTTQFAQLLPGAPVEGFQSFATFVFRFKRYIAYISGQQLNILSSPTNLVQAIRFKHNLVAVAAEDKTGKLIVTEEKDVWVLEPQTDGWTKVWWEKALLLAREDADDVAHCLSWGDDGEALIGGSQLITLFSTRPASKNVSPNIAAVDGEDIEHRRATWSKNLASPIHQAAFSPSATLIASRGRYDRLVKIWRRLSFEECLFDHTYLPHPGAVTHLQWRPHDENTEARRASGLSGRHDEDLEVLYTIANDGVLRVWRATGSHEVDILVLHMTVDLIAAIPQSPSLTIKGQTQPTKAPRYAVVLSSEHFCAAVNAAIGLPKDGKVDHTKELLKEMISNEPDVVVAFDGQGRMSAWGLQSIGHKRRTEDQTPTQPVHITHAEGVSFKMRGSPAVCGAWFQDDKFHMLSHSIADGGEITWWQGQVESFFSLSAPGEDRLRAAPAWCGHDSDVLELQPSGEGIVSRSHNELTQWEVGRSKSLRARRSYGISSDVLAATTLQDGTVLLTISATEASLWDKNGDRIAKSPYTMAQGGTFHVATSDGQKVQGVFVQDDAKVILVWTSRLSSHDSAALQVQRLALEEDYAFTVLVAMPFDSERVCLISATKEGRVACTLLSDDVTESADLEPFITFETGLLEPALFAATGEFAALVSQDRRELVVADLTDGYIEHRQTLGWPVSRLACFTPKPRHNFLAVAHTDSVEMLAQGRYEHHSSKVPTWISVRTISLSGLGFQVSGMAWLSDGSLAISAANSIFISFPNVDLSALSHEARDAIDAEQSDDKAMRLSSFAEKIKDSLPVWHPSMLSQLLHHGQPGLAASLLKCLAQKLKFYSDGDYLDPLLEESATSLIAQTTSQDSWLDDDSIADLREQLEEKNLPRISDLEQQRLKHIVEAMVYLREHVNALDRNALRYLFSWKLQILLHDDEELLKNGQQQPNGEVHIERFTPSMDWRAICFASHSTTQQALLDILVLHHDNKLTWSAASRYGIMAWLSDREALEAVFEQLGQTAYRSESPPNPVNASMYYLALHKKATLLALWRIATWHKEQRTTMNFLKKDFAQPDAKTAAKKNAYALMGKRRFHYSAAFFLLADDPSSAIAILAGQCEDPQLAIAVARLYCGDGSSELKKLLDDRIMPQAQQEGNRWLMSWCHSVMKNKLEAADSLVRPLDGLVKTWKQDDPVTVSLYSPLRGNTPSEHEYDAVLRSARLLRRMGLWLLALELVSQWEFKHTPTTNNASFQSNTITNGIDAGPKSVLDDFADLNISKPSPAKQEGKIPSMLDDFADPAPPPVMDGKAAREAKAAELLAKLKAKKAAPKPEVEVKEEKPKREPTQFKEPDSNSLLDNFGF
ncbi:Regulator of V-ATPase in vacuolar membrane protein 1 [Fulvia fulva]|nr:Regulator of V-ATPase in vacuolar membrane protein 1 [Fulvia fulva]